MIDAAIIGLGWWGRRHVAAVRGWGAGLRYILGVTHEPEEIGEFAAANQLPIVSDHQDAIANPAVRAVVLVMPHSLHPAQVEAAAAHAKHVFCEKPFAPGSKGYVEARSENELEIHLRGREPETRTFDVVNAVSAGINAFAKSIETGAAYPIPGDQIIHNVEVLQGIVRSARTGKLEPVG